jgi:hypothetical protein
MNREAGTWINTDSAWDSQMNGINIGKQMDGEMHKGGKQREINKKFWSVLFKFPS